MRLQFACVVHSSQVPLMLSQVELGPNHVPLHHSHWQWKQSTPGSQHAPGMLS